MFLKKHFHALLPLLLALTLLLGSCSGTPAASSAPASAPAGSAIQSEAASGETFPASGEAAGTESSPAAADSAAQSAPWAESAPAEQTAIREDGEYISKEEVAEYLYLYAHLPGNFITKSEAKALGWESSKGNLSQVAPGKSIGGDRFGNYEGLLPEAPGREYRECDIDSTGGYRGAKRIVYSNDGLIYYTEDHYEHFTLLYGEE